MYYGESTSFILQKISCLNNKIKPTQDSKRKDSRRGRRRNGTSLPMIVMIQTCSSEGWAMLTIFIKAAGLITEEARLIPPQWTTHVVCTVFQRGHAPSLQPVLYTSSSSSPFLLPPPPFSPYLCFPLQNTYPPSTFNFLLLSSQVRDLNVILL